MLRVSLTGPESTGKSTLAAQLAAHYGTTFAPEFAREYLADSGPHYSAKDLEEIARGQLAAEATAVAQAEAHGHGLVFFDSDLLVIKIWFEHSFGSCPEWIMQAIACQHYDLVLLMGVDLPWQPDPLREHPHLRQHFYDLYQRVLREQISNFAEVAGDYRRRFAQACFLVDELLSTAALAAPRAAYRAPAYTLFTPECQATFSSRGAELTSLIGTASGLEYLWSGDPAVWGRHAPVLFPLVGRLPADAYHYQGSVYRLPQHGFARDQEFAVLRQSATELVFRLQDDESTRAVFPFAFELTITYTLRGAQLSVRWDVRNPAPDQPLLFSIGAHPAVRCPLLPGERFEDYYFAFDHPVTLERHLLAGGLLTGKTARVLTQSQELPLSYELFANDALVFKHYDFTRLTLRSRKSARFVRFQFDGFPYLGLWTKGPGANFVCVEPWYGIASYASEPGELSEKEGILTLEPGQSFTATYSMEIG